MTSIVDPELDALERRLNRAVLIRRLVVGMAALVFGVLGVIVGGVLVWGTFHGSFGRRGLVRAAAVCLIVGVTTILIGWRTLRVGEVREDLSVHEMEPVPWRLIALATSVVVLAIAAIAAWPLGVYRWMGTLRSPCRSVFTPKDAAALGLPPFDIEHVEQKDSLCVVEGVAPGGERRTVSVRIDGPRSGYRFDDTLRFFRAERDEPLPGIGEEAHLAYREGEWLVAVKRGKPFLTVHLSSKVYDEKAARAVAGHVASRLDALDAMPADR